MPELPPPDPGDPETDRYRLFEAVAGLLAEISAAVPVLIVLDDLQWADRPTLLLLRHLARSPHNTRVSIMGAYRDVDQWSEGFDAALAGLRRERLMIQLDVGGLPEAEAMELVRLRAGGTPSLAFVQALYRETEGNPFFIEEIVRHLTDAGVRSAGRRRARPRARGAARGRPRRHQPPPGPPGPGLDRMAAGGGGDRPRLRCRPARARAGL